MKCPEGYIFGQDNDEYGGCDDCELWDSCLDYHKENQLKKYKPKTIKKKESMKQVKDLLPEVQVKINKDLEEKAKVILEQMEKEIQATEIVLEKMKEKRNDFLNKSIEELTFEELTPKRIYQHGPDVSIRSGRALVVPKIEIMDD